MTFIIKIYKWSNKLGFSYEEQFTTSLDNNPFDQENLNIIICG